MRYPEVRVVRALGTRDRQRNAAGGCDLQRKIVCAQRVTVAAVSALRTKATRRCAKGSAVFPRGASRACGHFSRLAAGRGRRVAVLADGALRAHPATTPESAMQAHGTSVVARRPAATQRAVAIAQLVRRSWKERRKPHGREHRDDRWITPGLHLHP
eukprot:CAMPEP_0181196854 /NCGR_PEP_ID=MMETSP1096-20121128/15703_1 /TAXON_ID=156174 ORGANISM="Chrysochromulina ericina, Strain CCMP281" /NCGR_SAMPLE_ID=MMETSP1096 /ASSEMBLY_ACC=CAM_ASM_000453 /LENGTH=156 /DNA_ID=CAMNT_0023286673 /DNA_START=980 /DNA_END=1450 /DNA_ORIENTATION=-